MSMVFCSGCGKEIHETALACPSCGAVTTVKDANSRASQANSEQEISQAWKKTFALLEKAGGPQLPKIRELVFGERFKVIFNVWAFLFGPFYYFAKGMWKKAIVLFAMCMVGIVILSLICEAVGISDAITTFIAPAIFARRANIDFYKKIVLGDNGWW
jgi:uncharacterized membrane protein YvbJ